MDEQASNGLFSHHVLCGVCLFVVVGAWIHYLAFDILVAQQCVKDAKQVSTYVHVHVHVHDVCRLSCFMCPSCLSLISMLLLSCSLFLCLDRLVF